MELAQSSHAPVGETGHVSGKPREHLKLANQFHSGVVNAGYNLCDMTSGTENAPALALDRNNRLLFLGHHQPLRMGRLGQYWARTLDHRTMVRHVNPVVRLGGQGLCREKADGERN